MTLLLIPFATLLNACALTVDDPSLTGAVVTSPAPSLSSAWMPGTPVVEDESPWYWSLGASLVTTSSSDGPSEDIDFDEGWGAQVAFGRRFYGENEGGILFDAEVEALYTDQEPESDGPFNDLNTAALMLNGLGAVPLGERAEVFFGGGVGLGWLDVGSSGDGLSSFDDEDGPFFSWQLRAGLRFDVGTATQLEVGYRFLNIDDAEIDDGIGDSDFDLQTKQHSLGLSLRFGV